MKKKTHKRRKYTVSKPILKRYQNQLQEAERFTNIIPHPMAQEISIGLRATREVTKRVRKETTYVEVRGHYRTTKDKKVYIKPHKRKIKKKYRLKL